MVCSFGCQFRLFYLTYWSHPIYTLYFTVSKYRCRYIYAPTADLDFVHLVDKKQKAGYATLKTNYQEGVSNAQPATTDYTRTAILRTIVQ